MLERALIQYEHGVPRPLCELHKKKTPQQNAFAPATETSNSILVYEDFTHFDAQRNSPRKRTNRRSVLFTAFRSLRNDTVKTCVEELRRK